VHGELQRPRGHGAPSSVGESGDVDVGGSVTSASGSATVLNYTGTGAGSTDRLWTITGKSPSDGINNDGGGPLSFANTGTAVEGVSGPRTLALGGTYTGAANNFAEALTDLGTGANVTGLVVKGGQWNISSASNTYSGGTNISGGTTFISQDAGLGSGTISFNTSVGFLNASSGSAGLTLDNAINTSSGATAQLRSDAPANDVFQLAGPISGAGGPQVGTASNSKNGPIELSCNSNSFTGNFATAFGLVQYTSVAAAGSNSSLGAASTAYNLSNGASYETFQYVGSGADSTNRPINWTGTTGTLALDASGTTATSAGTVQFLATANLRSGGSADTLVLQGSNAGANTLAQAINDGTGAGTIVNKTGVGKWVLTGADTYSGGTNVSGGTLVANGTGPLGTGLATVYAGGTLAGNGSTGVGSVNMSGGSITGGTGATKADALGTLSLGGPAYLGSGTYGVKLDLADASAAISPTGNDGSSVPLNGSGVTAVSDKLVISGLLTASAATSTPGSSLMITPVPTSAAAPYQTYSFVIADAQTNAGSGAGAFDALLQNQQIALSSATDAQGGTYSLSTVPDGATGEDLPLDVTDAPEPTSLLLAALAAAPLALGRRRRGRPMNGAVA
jgi:autotransporter-associated beta strand protein